ncbi:MAG: PilZ domain-containing protein [Proteobacteria bacterium]|nr:PilZ domain-containing protein [Pseudomonadota bacterium]
MAFWAKKKPENETEKKDTGANSLLKKKDEKKGAPPKRIDNLRILQKLRISLKSLGTGSEYHFMTKDLSATGMFVLCNDHKRYPFIPQSTLLETVIQLQADGTTENHELKCLCKIARIVEGQVVGYGVRIVQISPDQRQALEQFISKHGTPENFVPYSGGDKKDEDKSKAGAAEPPKNEAPQAETAETPQENPSGGMQNSA